MNIILKTEISKIELVNTVTVSGGRFDFSQNDIIEVTPENIYADFDGQMFIGNKSAIEVGIVLLNSIDFENQRVVSVSLKSENASSHFEHGSFVVICKVLCTFSNGNIVEAEGEFHFQTNQFLEI